MLQSLVGSIHSSAWQSVHGPENDHVRAEVKPEAMILKAFLQPCVSTVADVMPVVGICFQCHSGMASAPVYSLYCQLFMIVVYSLLS